MTIQNVFRARRRELKALRRDMLPSLRRLIPIIALTVVGAFAFAACAPAAAQSPTAPPTLPAPSATALPQQPVTLTVLALIAVAIRALMRSSNHSAQPSSGGALEILKERCARGEIIKDQYDNMQRDLKA